VSLSQEPALSILKKYMVCGYKDISGEPYAGMSGRHDREGNAVNTTNGAGPHNIQMFILSSDGTVLTCLPGYWAPQDLVTEIGFAAKLDKVWKDPHLSRTQKDQIFSQMQLAHVQEHSKGMVNRSHLQGFDANYEAQKPNSDAIKRPAHQVAAAYGGEWGGSSGSPGWTGSGNHLAASAFKTTDEIMHERMAKRPFVSYDRFDVATFSDYGLWRYDKEEDARLANGMVDREKAKTLGTIGDPESQKRHANSAAVQQNTNSWGTHGWGSQ
jgi:hypothetical protein